MAYTNYNYGTSARKLTGQGTAARKLVGQGTPARNLAGQGTAARKLTTSGSAARKLTGQGTSARKLTTSGSAARNLPTRKQNKAQAKAPQFKVTAGVATSVVTAPSIAALAVKVLAIAVLVFACAGVCRITLSSVAIAAAIESNEISDDIEVARETGNTLEVEQSTLSNPTRIKTEAASIGMVDPETTNYITLSEDVVSLDEQGALSLSDSVEVVAGIG